MSDRPTYKDYLFYEKDGYIRSGERYFAITEERTSIFSIVTYVLMIAAFAFVLWLTTSDLIWHAWLGEAYLLLWAHSIFRSVRHFRLCRFKPLPQNTPAWCDARELKYSPGKKIIFIAAQAVVLIMGMLALASGGFTISLIRSQLDGGGIVYAEFSVDSTGTFYEDSYATEESVMILLPDPTGRDIQLNLAVVHTPDIARLSLDGIPLPDDQQPYRIQNMLDLQDYFKQETYFRMSGNLLHDGSVLTLTCGELTREWVFEVADEEAS